MSLMYQLIARVCDDETSCDEGGPRRRRGGWNPKARANILYGRPEALGALRWEHDTSCSTLWLYFNTPEEPYWDEQFRRAIGVPRAIFNYYVELIERVPGFGVREVGDCKRARHPQDLRMKLCSWLQVLRFGSSFFKAAIDCCLSEKTVRVFFHDVNAWLVENEYEKHVYYPQTAEYTSNLLKKKLLAWVFPEP